MQTPIVARSYPVTLTQARADSPEPLLFPAWLPFARPSAHVQQVDLPTGGVAETIIEYQSHDGRSVLLTESHEAACCLRVPVTSEAGTIDGKPATYFGFLSGTPTSVAWRLPNGHYLTVSTQGLSRDDLVRVAESLQAQP
jgi:hypothetical protein